MKSVILLLMVFAVVDVFADPSEAGKGTLSVPATVSVAAGIIGVAAAITNNDGAGENTTTSSTVTTSTTTTSSSGSK